MQGEVFIDEVTDDIYTYNQSNELFISTGDIDHDTMIDLQHLLKNKSQKWWKVTTPSWAYQTPTNSPMLYIKWGTGRYFYEDITNEDRPYKIVPSLLQSQLIILLAS